MNHPHQNPKIKPQHWHPPITNKIYGQISPKNKSPKKKKTKTKGSAHTINYMLPTSHSHIANPHVPHWNHPNPNLSTIRRFFLRLATRRWCPWWLILLWPVENKQWFSRWRRSWCSWWQGLDHFGLSSRRDTRDWKRWNIRDQFFFFFLVLERGMIYIYIYLVNYVFGL